MNYKLKFSIGAVLLMAIPSLGYCENKGKRPGVLKKKYSHACPGGTERIGDAPPKSSMVFCRQVLEDGTRLEGDYTAFYRNGNKKIEGEYVSGKREGTWTSYYRGGQLSATKEFKDGKLVEKIAYSKRGDILKSNKEKREQEAKANPESEYGKSLRYKKSVNSTRKATLGWSPRRKNN